LYASIIRRRPEGWIPYIFKDLQLILIITSYKVDGYLLKRLRLVVVEKYYAFAKAHLAAL